MSTVSGDDVEDGNGAEGEPVSGETAGSETTGGETPGAEPAGAESPGAEPDSGGPGDAEMTGTEATGAEATGVEVSSTTDVSNDERTCGILVQAVAFTGLVVPFANIIGPLVIWLLKKEESRFVDENGKQSLNFQSTCSVIIFVATLTLFVGVRLILVPLMGLAWLVLVVLGTVTASNGEVYDYPLAIDLVS